MRSVILATQLSMVLFVLILRLQPLMHLPVPWDVASMRCTLWLLSYCSQWIPHYYSHIQPLLGCKSFPISRQAAWCLDLLRDNINHVSLDVLDENLTLDLEQVPLILLLGPSCLRWEDLLHSFLALFFSFRKTTTTWHWERSTCYCQSDLEVVFPHEKTLQNFH